MLYELDLDSPAQSRRVSIEHPARLRVSEKHIEDFLASHLVELIPEEQLMLLAQERPFHEEADILALDREGTLYIFELKRWRSSTENLLQVMRYGQKFGRYSYAQLEAMAQKQQRLTGELSERHREYFDLEQPLSEEVFNRQQKFVVVTNGVDQDTLDAIAYWKEKGISIDSLTYKLYRVAGQPYLQFDTYNPWDAPLLETNPGAFIVNTNRSYMKDAWRDMLGDGQQGRAAAYYVRKNAVQRISKGSTVFLYHTGVGVIACGKATGSVQVADYCGDKDAQYYIPLQFEWALTKPDDWSRKAPKAHEINARIGASHRFRPTVFNASEDMCQAIQTLWATRSQTLNSTVTEAVPE